MTSIPIVVDVNIGCSFGGEIGLSCRLLRYNQQAFNSVPASCYVLAAGLHPFYARDGNGFRFSQLVHRCNRKRNLSLEAENFYIQQWRNWSCRKVLNRKSQSFQLLRSTGKASVLIVRLSQFRMEAVKGAVRLACKVKCYLSINYLIRFRFGYTVCCRVFDLSFRGVPRANNCADRAERLNPICPFRFIEAAQNSYGYKSSNTANKKYNGFCIRAFCPFFKNFHKVILS